MFLAKMCDYNQNVKPALIFESQLENDLENQKQDNHGKLHRKRKLQETNSSAPLAFMDKLHSIKNLAGWSGLSLPGDDIVE